VVNSCSPGGVRAVKRCDALAVPPFSDTPHGLYRAYLTPAYDAAQRALAGWMEQAGMTVRRDAAANLIGRYEGTDPAAPALLLGSHLDSVRDAGSYDGPLGIMLGVELVAVLHDSRRRMPFPIEVIAFGDEEGSRFPTAMLTSRAVAGTLAHEALDIADGNGVALAEAGVDVGSYLTAARAPGSTFAYLEAHIEQGPVLEAEGLAVGTVIGVAAQYRYRVRVTGVAGHAGTNAMSLRRDALAGAAEMMVAIERIAREDGSDLVATVGIITAEPGAANVVPGAVGFTIDVRAGDPARHERAAAMILDTIAAIADVRKLGFSAERVFELAASPCDPALMELLDAATIAAGEPVRRLVSGAGHDAISMAALCPTAMLFIRCKGGVSHNPAESVDPADAEIALNVMLGFVERLAGQFKGAGFGGA
jgi:allantoate deiminase